MHYAVFGTLRIPDLRKYALILLRMGWLHHSLVHCQSTFIIEVQCRAHDGDIRRLRPNGNRNNGKTVKVACKSLYNDLVLWKSQSIAATS